MPNIWDDVLGRIEAKVNRHSYYTWFKPTSFVADQGTTIHVRVPNALFRDWLTKHYSTVINESLAELNRTNAGLLVSHRWRGSAGCGPRRRRLAADQPDEVMRSQSSPPCRSSHFRCPSPAAAG